MVSSFLMAYAVAIMIPVRYIWYALDATEHELNATEQTPGVLSAECPMTPTKNSPLSQRLQKHSFAEIKGLPD
jgi:hypothetical protein